MKWPTYLGNALPVRQLVEWMRWKWLIFGGFKAESTSAHERARSLFRHLSPAIALICPDPYPCQWRAEQPRVGEIYGALDKACQLNLNGMSLYRLLRGAEPVATSLKGKTDLTILRQNVERVRSTRG